MHCKLGLIREALEPCGTRVWGYHPNNMLVEVVSSFPYLGLLITDDAECTKDIRGKLAKGLGIGAKVKKIWQNHGISISTNIRLMKALVRLRELDF